MRTLLFATCKSLLVVMALMAIAVLADENTAPVSVPAKHLNSQNYPGNKPIGSPSTQFGKTVRLEFNLVSSDSSQPFVVLCSEGDFAFHYEHETSDSGNSVDIAGSVTSVDDTGRQLLTFKIAVRVKDAPDNSRGLLIAMGSSMISLDKPKELVSIDNYSIQITSAIAE